MLFLRELLRSEGGSPLLNGRERSGLSVELSVGLNDVVRRWSVVLGGPSVRLRWLRSSILRGAVARTGTEFA